MIKYCLPLCAFAGVASLIAGAADERRVLPTEWALSPASRTVVATKTLPQSAVFTGDGKHLIVLEGGAGSPGIRVLTATTLATERDIAVRGAYGVPLADRNGTGFWASGGSDTISHYDAVTGTSERSIALPRGFWAAGIARAPRAARLAVSGDLADAVVFIDEGSGTVSAPVHVGHHPAGLAFSQDGRTLYVASWSGTTLSVVDVASQAVRGEIAVGRHPEALLLSRDGARLYVSESDDDSVGVVDTASGKRIASVNVAPLDGRNLFGASPTALALSADGRRLYVACSAINAIAVVDVSATQPRLIGALPTGWYPTALALEMDGKTIDVVDGKGEGGRANPEFDPFHRARNPDTSGYIASGMIGSVRRITIPDDAELAAMTQAVRDNARGFGRARDDAPSLGGIVRTGGPIHHVIYVIKENRTYDQVLGDLPGADGDARLTLFGERVTPNEHALAARFGILDNTYANAQVSADGHNWSMAAFANDYLEKMWPQNYGGRRIAYDFEDGADASVAHAGYLWNVAARGHVSLRNYGEFTSEAPQRGGDVTSQMDDLKDVTDPKFIGFDLNVRDEAREAEWTREFDAYVANRTLPALELVRLPNDHTFGTRVGKRTPTAYVAENDLALGRLVDKVSHSPYWRDTAIFVVEDDAQNGPDHVDAQRMTAYVISPYSAGGVLHEHYSTAGIVGTIEAILGLPHLSFFDAAALPLTAVFGNKPDLRPYTVLPETVNLDAVNTAAAYRAADSARIDFSHEDRAPDATLNDIIWHAVRGRTVSTPSYGVFDARTER